MNRRLLNLTLAVSLALTTTVTVFAAPLNTQLSSKSTQLKKDQTAYSQAQQKTEALGNKIEVLDSQIEKVLLQVKNNKEKINKTKVDIKKAQKNIDKAQGEIKEEQDAFNKRIRAMYMSGGATGYIGVLLDSENFNDFLSKAETVKRIINLDKEMINTLNEKKQKVEEQKQTLVAKTNKLQALNTENQQKVASLNKDKAQQDDLVKEAKKEQEKYASKLSVSKQEVDKIKQLIAQGIAQEKRNSASKSSSSSSSRNVPSRGGDSISVSVSSNAVVNYAMQFRGTPYLWGGNGPSSFDCSGFVIYVYRHFGVYFQNRTAAAMSSEGRPVSRGELRPGDVIYFGSNIHHVGIYVGDGCYIHAPKTGDVVKISSLGSRSDFNTARRMIN